MEITGRWKNRTISFWENVAAKFGNRCSFWNCSKTAELGQLGRPTTDDWHHLSWVSQVWVELGPITWAQSLIQFAPVNLGLPSTCAIGPGNLGPMDAWLAPITGLHQWLGAWSKCDLARALASRSPEDKIRSYPLPVVRFESDSNRDYRIITKGARDSYLRNPNAHGRPLT